MPILTLKEMVGLLPAVRTVRAGTTVYPLEHTEALERLRTIDKLTLFGSAYYYASGGKHIDDDY